HRFGPGVARPLADGPKLGTQLERLIGQQLDGAVWSQTFPASKDMLLVFISPQCPTCNELLPHVKDFPRAHRNIDVVLISTMEHMAMNHAYVAFRQLERLPYVIGAKLADELEIDGTPYALHLDRAGIVTAKGLVNHYEHLLSLCQSNSLNGVERVGTEQPLASQ